MDMLTNNQIFLYQRILITMPKIPKVTLKITIEIVINNINIAKKTKTKKRDRYGTNQDQNDNDKQDTVCNDFMRNGYIYSILQTDAAILLRGMNLMSSDNKDKQNQGALLYERQLYPYMLDSFTWINTDGGTIIKSKEQLKSKALILAQAVPNLMGIESFSYFECVDGNNLTMVMYFNAMEKWDDIKSAEVPRKEGGSPERIERYWNCAMHFQYDYDHKQFMIYRFEYDDPLYDDE
eukprot:504485_1